MTLKKHIAILFAVGSYFFLLAKNLERKGSRIKFDSIVVEQHIPLLLDADTTLPYSDVRVSYTYPTRFKDEESLVRLQQIFQGTFFENVGYDSMSPQEAMDYYIKTYGGLPEHFNMFYEEKARLEDRTPRGTGIYCPIQTKFFSRMTRY